MIRVKENIEHYVLYNTEYNYKNIIKYRGNTISHTNVRKYYLINILHKALNWKTV